MELIGKLVKKLPQEEGQGRNGQWVKGAFVVETEEQYPKKVCFTVWGEKMINALTAIKEDDQIKVYFSVESREHNERWYTDLKCFRIDSLSQVGMNAPNQNVAKMSQEFDAPMKEDDLPY
mgnify:CR=1 FL=1